MTHWHQVASDNESRHGKEVLVQEVARFWQTSGATTAFMLDLKDLCTKPALQHLSVLYRHKCSVSLQCMTATTSTSILCTTDTASQCMHSILPVLVLAGSRLQNIRHGATIRRTLFCDCPINNRLQYQSAILGQQPVCACTCLLPTNANKVLPTILPP